MSEDDTLLRSLLLIAALIVLVPLLMMVFMLPMMGLWGWGHMGDGGMWNGTGSSWLVLWLLPLGVIAALGYLLYRAVRPPTGDDTDPALAELRMAYARGDLSDEEFEERRQRLQTRNENN
ncbi:SHOCT domain-containing protein [Natronorubrum sulfidifaciens]|uniref:SHOCT domain-containing protein n=1 Tax=Natronorubrum sulfidifaciens JCM 14089 TaxID=1230460 RepID=L9WBJ2_9EURY|nr:SHOCT domain-containing protein [Natronorubrum sulfidifaciens]ELY46727.1 hypothetical protein C495_06453 [Natronorubrum sulfidifaciens JCM 14089]